MSDRVPSDCLLSSWMLRNIHEQKVCFIVFTTLPLVNMLEMAKNIFFEDISDGVLCKAAESFEDEARSTLN